VQDARSEPVVGLLIGVAGFADNESGGDHQTEYRGGEEIEAGLFRNADSPVA